MDKKPWLLYTIECQNYWSSQKKGYKIEKIVYESIPGFFFTGCLFIPDGRKGKAPAILNVIGHTEIT